MGYFSSETLEVPAAADVGGEWLLSRLVQAKPVKKVQLNKSLIGNSAGSHVSNYRSVY